MYRFRRENEQCAVRRIDSRRFLDCNVIWACMKHRRRLCPLDHNRSVRTCKQRVNSPWLMAIMAISDAVSLRLRLSVRRVL